MLSAIHLVWLFLAWILAGATCALLALGFGARPAALGEAAALAMAPGLAGLILVPWIERASAALAVLACWLVAAVGLAAGSGGAVSPLAVLFAAAPMLALAVGRRGWAVWTGAAAMLAYALSAALALAAPEPATALDPLPELLSVATIALVAALAVLIQSAPQAPSASAGSADELARRVAEVSHELRTPLTHILGFAELIERQIFGPIEARYVEYAGLIRKSGGHLLDLVNDHLDASRIEAGKYALELAQFDARAVVEEVVSQSLDAAARKQIALSAWLPQHPLLVRADARVLRRMLVNTLGNALKFTPDGGRVVVAAKAAGKNLVLETIDNGPGIPADERALLGQAYQRGAGGAGVEGAGLGLSLVRSMSALHGGALSFHDAPGGGALVRIELPVLADA